MLGLSRPWPLFLSLSAEAGEIIAAHRTETRAIKTARTECSSSWRLAARLTDSREFRLQILLRTQEGHRAGPVMAGGCFGLRIGRARRRSGGARAPSPHSPSVPARDPPPPPAPPPRRVGG